MRMKVLPAVLLALFVSAPAPASAQTAQVLSVQGSFLGAALGGDAFSGAEGITFEPGSGFELQARWNPSALSIGAGVQYTVHPVTVTGAEGIDVTLDFSGLFIEPRYVIFLGSELAAPYVSARIMSLVSTLAIPSLDFEEQFDAVGLNVGGGLLIRISSRLNLDMGLTAGTITYIYEGAENESGASVVARLGLALGL